MLTYKCAANQQVSPMFDIEMDECVISSTFKPEVALSYVISTRATSICTIAT